MTNDKSKITNWISCFRTISAHYSPLEFYAIWNKIREGVPYQQDFSFRKRRLGWWQYLHLLWINWRSNSNFRRSRVLEAIDPNIETSQADLSFSVSSCTTDLVSNMKARIYEIEIEYESLLGKVFFHYLLVHCAFLCRSLVEQRCVME